MKKAWAFRSGFIDSGSKGDLLHKDFLAALDIEAARGFGGQTVSVDRIPCRIVLTDGAQCFTDARGAPNTQIVVGRACCRFTSVACTADN